jgi:hypothetical protein
LIDITFCQIEPCSGDYEDPNSDIDLGLHDPLKFSKILRGPSCVDNQNRRR